MVHMGPEHTQCCQKTARLAPGLQMGLKGHDHDIVGPLRILRSMSEEETNAHTHTLMLTPVLYATPVTHTLHAILHFPTTLVHCH